MGQLERQKTRSVGTGGGACRVRREGVIGSEGSQGFGTGGRGVGMVSGCR